MRLRIAAVLLMLLSPMFLLVGCGSQKTSPKFVANEQPSSDTYALKPSAYVLTPDARPDLTKLQVYQKAPRYSPILPSPDGIIVDGRAHLTDGTRWEMIGSGPDGPTVAVTETLLGDNKPVTYVWFIGEEHYAAFTDGPIYKGVQSVTIEVLSYKPFDSEVRVIFLDAKRKPIASREFTVMGIKPAIKQDSLPSLEEGEDRDGGVIRLQN